jgi:hypothetical protein
MRSFQHELAFDRCALPCRCHRLGNERLRTLLQESLALTTRSGALRSSIDLQMPASLSVLATAKLANCKPQSLFTMSGPIRALSYFVVVWFVRELTIGDGINREVSGVLKMPQAPVNHNLAY